MSNPSRTPQQTFLSLVALAPALSDTAADVIYTQAPKLRVTLADNEHLSDSMRQRLARDPSAEVRAAALSHCSDPELLRAAAAADSVSERVAASANPATPAAALVALAKSEPAGVVRHLLTNPSLPTEVAMTLAKRFVVGQLWGPGRRQGSSQGSAMWRSPGVAATLRAHPQVAACWRDDPEPTTARVIAYSPTLDHATAMWLATNKRARTIQLALAGNPFVSEEVCDTLTGPTALEARKTLRSTLGDRSDLAAAANDLLSTAEGRSYLVAADSRTVDWLLSSHPDLEPETAVALAGRTGGQTVEPDVMARLVNRFGAAAAAATAGAQSPSRLRVTGQWSPLLKVVEMAVSGRMGRLVADPVGAATLAEQLTENLREDRDAWQVAVSILLSAGPEFTGEDLATLSLGVSS